MSPVASSLEKMRFGRQVKMYSHGVQIESPSANDRPMLKMVFQMTNQRKVSRKNSRRSMMYMMMSVKSG